MRSRNEIQQWVEARTYDIVDVVREGDHRDLEVELDLIQLIEEALARFEPDFLPVKEGSPAWTRYAELRLHLDKQVMAWIEECLASVRASNYSTSQAVHVLAVLVESALRRYAPSRHSL